MKKLELCECSLPTVNTESFHMVQHYKANDVRIWVKEMLKCIQILKFENCKHTEESNLEVTRLANLLHKELLVVAKE